MASTFGDVLSCPRVPQSVNDMPVCCFEMLSNRVLVALHLCKCSFLCRCTPPQQHVQLHQSVVMQDAPHLWNMFFSVGEYLTPAECVLPVATSLSVVAAQMHESVVIPLCYHAGCTLPVEMFFPIREYPTPALEEALAEVGVVCRPLPEVDLPQSNATDTETDLSGFTMKVAALLLSRFQEVSRGVEPNPSCVGTLPWLLPVFGGAVGICCVHVVGTYSTWIMQVILLSTATWQ